MKTKKLVIALVALFSSAALYVGCDEDGSINIFSDSDDAALGEQVSAEIEADPTEYPIYTADPSVKSYIKSRIFDHILASGKVTKKNVYAYELEIVARHDILNAFALPGGKIYLYTGLLKYLDNEAALAGVVGHEIAHAEKRHSTQRMTKQYGVSVLLSLLLGQNPSQIAEIAANLFVGFALLANSRSDEDQSDEFSFKYLQDTRYYPGGVKFFFEQLVADGKASASADPSLETYLSTHPEPAQRVANTNGRLTAAGIGVRSFTDTGDGIYRNEYNINVRNKLP